MKKNNNKSLKTLNLHRGKSHQQMISPLYMSRTFVRESLGEDESEFLYARCSHPNAELLEEELSILENGERSLIFSSGMSAISAFLNSLGKQDKILVQRDCYFVTRKWLDNYGQKNNICFDYIDIDNNNYSDLEVEIKKHKPTYIWLEMPNNPYWNILDIEHIVGLAKKYNVKTIVDHTAVTGVLFKPLDYGVDYVIYSASKSLNGHSDVIAGVIVTNTYDGLWNDIFDQRRNNGTVLNPFDCWLLSRSLKTAALRLEKSSQSAQEFALYFNTHPLVENIRYPGLFSNADYKIAKKYFKKGFGPVLTIELKLSIDKIYNLIENLNIFKHATSFGSVDSVVEHRQSIEQEKGDVPSNFLRVSIGLEDIDMLIEDFEQALKKIPMTQAA